MATEAQIKFATTLYEERGMELPEDFASLSVSDASAEIDQLKRVETGPVTPEQLSEITDLLAVLGPRNDGKDWNIPEQRGHASAFINQLQRWVKGKQYGERLAAARERIEARGLQVAEAPVAVGAEADSIPF